MAGVIKCCPGLSLSMKRLVYLGEGQIELNEAMLSVGGFFRVWITGRLVVGLVRQNSYEVEADFL